jgi:hypothetical protein
LDEIIDKLDKSIRAISAAYSSPVGVNSNTTLVLPMK